MAHKVHPKAYRMRGMADWLSRGYYGQKPAKFLREDFAIREFLKKPLKDAEVEKVEIERSPGRTVVMIFSCRPALIIGRGGKGVEALKLQMEKKILKNSALAKGLKIEIKEVKNPWTQSVLAAKWIAVSLEKRMPFRRTLKQALEKIVANKEVKGARVEVAGRLDGASIARTEWLSSGRLPRQTLRADIDYGQAEAHCTYGMVGIKVWIYKGDRFN